MNLNRFVGYIILAEPQNSAEHTLGMAGVES